MKILQINSVCGIRSTGRICTDLADVLERNGHECKIAYGRETVPEKYQKYAVRIGCDFGVKLHALQSRIFDNAGTAYDPQYADAENGDFTVGSDDVKALKIGDPRWIK